MAFISIGNLAGGGVVPDHPAYDLPPNVFDEVIDVRFDVNGIRPAQQEVEVFPTMLANPLQLTKVKLGAGVEGWVYMDETSMYIIENGIHVEITRNAGEGGAYSATEQTGWQEAILHGIPIFSNGRDIPQQLDPLNSTSPVTNLANWPTGLRAEVLRPYKVFLIALKLQTGGGPYDQQSLIWSAPADPGQVPPSWDYTDPATQAGLYTFSETDDRIIDGLQLGDEFIVYKEKSIYAMRYIGGTFVMSIKRRPGDVGLLAKGAIATIPSGHFFVSGDDIYVYNGTGLPQSVATGRVRKEFFSTITTGQKTKVFVEHDAANKVVWVFYPTNGGLWCDRALVWNYENNTWAFRSVPHVSSASFGEIDQVNQRSWDDVSDIWGGLYTQVWRDETLTWGNNTNVWTAQADGSSWSQDTTTWESSLSWDASLTTDIWDSTEYVPVVDNLVMATRLGEERVYDPIKNESSANGVTWKGSSIYPPLWLVPNTGTMKTGSLVKRGLAIVGKSHDGALEVNRTVQKIMTEFYPEVEFGSVRIRFGTHDSPRGDIDWGSFETFDAETDQKLDPFVSGRYLAFEVQGAGEGTGDWLLSGFGMEINKGGRY